VNTNPYQPPNESCAGEAARGFDRRLAFLLAPPLIPLVVHGVVRAFIPAGESAIYHGMFMLGAHVVACIWAQTMIDRLEWPLWRACLLACGVWGGVLATALLSPKIVDYLSAIAWPAAS
jgi:hypothetical protein